MAGEIFAEFVKGLASALVGAGVGVVGAVWGLRKSMKSRIDDIDERSAQNEAALFGDPDDPNQEGIAQITKDNRDSLNNMEKDVRWIKDHLNGKE